MVPLVDIVGGMVVVGGMNGESDLDEFRKT